MPHETLVTLGHNAATVPAVLPTVLQAAVTIIPTLQRGTGHRNWGTGTHGR